MCFCSLLLDFLNDMPGQEETRIALLDCCACFGSSRYDVNTSLTAIGMIWTIADQDSPPSAVDVSRCTHTNRISPIITRNFFNGLFHKTICANLQHVLSKLAVLAFDDRVEVCIVLMFVSLCTVMLMAKN